MVRDRATFRREDDFDGDRLIAGTERDSIIGQIRFSFRGFFIYFFPTWKISFCSHPQCFRAPALIIGRMANKTWFMDSAREWKRGRERVLPMKLGKLLTFFRCAVESNKLMSEEIVLPAVIFLWFCFSTVQMFSFPTRHKALSFN